MRYGFFFHQTRCSGCQACVVACKDWNGVKPGRAALRQLHVVETGTFVSGDFKLVNMVYSCNHCMEPACMKVCPSGAIYRESGDSNIVIINRDKCKGVGACIKACPFGAPQTPEDKQETAVLSKNTRTKGHKVMKCDACSTRRAAGKVPVCVAACPQRAIEWGEYDNLAAKYGENQIAKGFPTNISTKPSILIKSKN